MQMQVESCISNIQRFMNINRLIRDLFVFERLLDNIYRIEWNFIELFIFNGESKIQ